MGISGTSWGSYAPLFGPLVALGTLLLLSVLMRWAFSGGRSLVARPSAPGDVDSYGLLVEVAVPASAAQGERMCRLLIAAGVRATLVSTRQGARVMVFPEDADRARVILDSSARE